MTSEELCDISNCEQVLSMHQDQESSPYVNYIRRFEGKQKPVLFSLISWAVN